MSRFCPHYPRPADFRGMAEQMGYKVLVAEGSPIVLKIIVSGYVDAIVGVACLNVLEKAIDKILLAGIPCMAVPLLSSDCRNTSVDEDWVNEMIRVQAKPDTKTTNSYVHLLRAASNLFKPDELDRIVPRVRGSKRLESPGSMPKDPISGTEAIAYDFLGKGGKHSRPFITLAVHDALTWMRGKGMIAAMPVKDFVAAVSVGLYEGRAVLDLDYAEDSACQTDMNVVMTGAGRFVEVQGTAEGDPFARDELDRLLGLAGRGLVRTRRRRPSAQLQRLAQL